LGCSKSHCVFCNRWKKRCPRLFVCERDECQIFTRILLLTLNLKIKKKVDAIRSSFVLAIVVRTWRILKSIYWLYSVYYFKKGKKAIEAKEKLRQKCRQKMSVPELVHPILWFFSQRRSGRPSKIDNDEMKALMQANKHSMVRLATALKVSVGSVYDHLKSSFIKKLNVWVPHELKEIWLIAWASAINSSNEENDLFLKRMITGNEKWIVYNNVSRKRSWNRQGETTSKEQND